MGLRFSWGRLRLRYAAPARGLRVRCELARWHTPTRIAFVCRGRALRSLYIGQYLSKYGLSGDVLKDPSWTKDAAKADKSKRISLVPTIFHDARMLHVMPCMERHAKQNSSMLRALTAAHFRCFRAVAAAILDWGIAEGATNFSHVFQPLGSVGVRHGVTGQLHNQLFTFGSDGKPEYKFKGGELLRGETDGSSYPNGGLRSKSCLRDRMRAPSVTVCGA